MMIVYLGGTPLGMCHKTDPTGDDEHHAATIPEHAVARGKPVPQDVGDELIRRTFRFFFDEAFCDPASARARLEAAMRSRSPLPLVIPGLSYTGARFIVSDLTITTIKTDRSGRPVRIEASIGLMEAPRQGAGELIGAAIASTANAAANVLLRQ